MAANSMARRFLKRVLFPILNERSYQSLQCLAKAWDIYTRSWTEPELDLIPSAVREGEWVLDIGANYGLYTYHLSRAVGASGRVYAFEPVPFTYATLTSVCRVLRLQNVKLVPKGCSERAGRVEFTLPLQRSGAIVAGLAHIGQRNNERGGKEQHLPFERTRGMWCDVVALDSFLPVPTELSFMKCDVEGAELLVMRGAENLINRFCPTVLCEINPWFLEGFGIRLKELVGFFIDKGYQLYSYEVVGGHGRLRSTFLDEIVEQNYLFVHPRRRDRLASFLASSSEV
jgi:FkbM family methyltransferase